LYRIKACRATGIARERFLLTKTTVSANITVSNENLIFSVDRGVMEMEFTTVTKANFDDVVMKSDKPMLVGFSAPWCGYCKRLKPALGQLAAEIADKVGFGAVNVDEQEELASRFHIETIPSLMLVKDGKFSELLVNPPSKAAVKDWLTEKGVL
jgi:thioredoxin 1